MGITDHTVFDSNYFFDPNGHWIERAALTPAQNDDTARINAVIWDMFEKWGRTKKAPKHADWMQKKGCEGA